MELRQVCFHLLVFFCFNSLQWISWMISKCSDPQGSLLWCPCSWCLCKIYLKSKVFILCDLFDNAEDNMNSFLSFSLMKKSLDSCVLWYDPHTLHNLRTAEVFSSCASTTSTYYLVSPSMCVSLTSLLLFVLISPEWTNLISLLNIFLKHCKWAELYVLIYILNVFLLRHYWT